MKKVIRIIVIMLVLVLGLTALTACGGEKKILVVSREAGSGTRDGFDGLIRNAAGDTLAKKADGTAQPSSIFVSSLNIQDGTAKVITKIESSKNAIGYISLGSVGSSIKSVSVDEVAPSAETVLNGTYALKRPFVIMTKESGTLTQAATDFYRYLNSVSAQSIVEAEKYVKQEDEKSVAYSEPSSILSGIVKLRGSTSVEPLMKKLIADYQAKGSAKVAGITFDLDAAGSSAGVTAVKNDNDGNIIGMSSSAKDLGGSGMQTFAIALDAIAVIVNKGNSIANLTITQIFDIYTGAITKFSEIV